MKESQRDYPATRPRLGQIFRDQGISPQFWERALELAGFKPNKTEWLRFLDLLIMAMGTIFLIAGIFFFFAFNWDDMSKWSRFAIVEVAVILATVLAFFFKLDTWAGRMYLGAAAMLMGLALAVIGQAYQTGADNWQLFQTWLMLLTAWVLISRWNIMYLIWMILANLSLVLFWQQEISRDWQLMNLLIVGINLAFIIIWDGLARFSKLEFVKQGRWFLYIFGALSLLHVSFLMWDYIFMPLEYRLMPYAPFVYLAVLVVMLLSYTQMRRDLLMLTMSALSILFVLIAWIGRILGDTMLGNGDAVVMYFLIMFLVTIALTVLLVTLLRRIHKAWEITS